MKKSDHKRRARTPRRKKSGGDRSSSQPKKSRNRRKRSKTPKKPKTWKCLQCDRDFKSENSMISHQKSKNHSNLTVECPQCYKKYRDLDHLNRHMESSGHKTPRGSFAKREDERRRSLSGSRKTSPRGRKGRSKEREEEKIAVVRRDSNIDAAKSLRVTAKPYIPLYHPAAYKSQRQTRKASVESISATDRGVKLGRKERRGRSAQESPRDSAVTKRSVGSTVLGRQLSTTRPTGFVVKVPVDLPNLDAPAPPINYDIGAGWTVFWNPPTSLEHSTHNSDYLKSLREIADFQGVANFWDKIKSLQKPSRIKNGAHNLMAFRKGLVPAWESFPYGGCWIINFNRWEDACQQIDALWETVLFGLASEAFGTPEVVGASIHIRTRGYRVCIWNRDNRAGDVRFAIADKLRMLLSIHPRKEIQYKYFSMSLADGSTTSQATPYQFIKVTF